MKLKNVFISSLTFAILGVVPAYTQDARVDSIEASSQGSDSRLESADAEKGESLFKTHCTACHHLELRLVGPALKDVHNRRSEEWIISFVRGSQDMIKSGDSTAVGLFNQFNQIVMPDQPVNESQITDILAYIKSSGATPTEKGSIARPVQPAKAAYVPLKFSDFRFWIIYTVMVILIFFTLYFLIENHSITGKSQ